MTGPRVWKVKLALERTEDYARVAALLGQCEVGSERQTTHLLDTVDGTFAAAGWCVRLRRTEPLSGQHADTAPQYVASIRAHARSLQDALAQVRPGLPWRAGVNRGGAVEFTGRLLAAAPLDGCIGSRFLSRTRQSSRRWASAFAMAPLFMRLRAGVCHLVPLIEGEGAARSEALTDGGMRLIAPTWPIPMPQRPL